MAFVNEGAWDRIVRILVGTLLLYASWANWPGTAAVVLVVIGAVALITGLVGWCPAYAIFQFSTRKKVAS